MKNKAKIVFHITRFGDTEEFSSLARLSNDRVSIEVLSHLDQDSCQEVLMNSDVGLCLKDPDSELGKTTFSSKVIEIAANRFTLLSTRVSDVPNTLRNTALFPDNCDAIESADKIALLARNPIISRDLVLRGYRQVIQQNSPTYVGVRLANFLTERK